MRKFLTWALSVCAVVSFIGCGGEPLDDFESDENVDSVVGAVCKAVKLQSSTPGPLPSNSVAVLTATGASCDPGQTAEYRFMYRREGGPTTYTEFRGWNTSATANFDNAGLPSGKYTLLVRARNVGSTKQYDSSSTRLLSSGNVCTSVALTPTPASAPPGTAVTLNAAASCTEGAAEYQFFYRPAGTATYTLLRGWGGSNFVWNTGGNPIGEYRLLVQARGAGNTSKFEADFSRLYTLSDTCASVTGSVSPPTPQIVGTSVTVTGGATCLAGGTAEFRFSYRPTETSVYTEFRGWGPNTAVWSTAGLAPGNYRIRIESRAVGYTGAPQGMKALATYTLSPAPAVVFNDPNLEAAVRTLVGIPSGPIPPSAVAPITDLDISNLGITDLTGLEYFTNLVTLESHQNQITSLAPISGLTSLEVLNAHSNQIGGSLTAVSGLTNLVVLQLAVNQIAGDLSHVAGLTNLQALSVGDNQLTGTLEPVASLANLISLQAPNNQLTGSLDPIASLTGLSNVQLQINQLDGDLSALGGLPNLGYVALYINSINIDLTPLVANPGVDSGDTLDVWSNPIDCGVQAANIADLTSRGVVVNSECFF